MAAKQRTLVFSILGAAAVVGAVFAHAIAWGMAKAELPNMLLLGRQLQLSQILGFAAAGAGALVVLRAPRPRQLAMEVVEELYRVAWPSREETSHATVVVMVCVAVSAAFLGLFDTAWLALSTLLLGGPAR